MEHNVRVSLVEPNDLHRILVLYNQVYRRSADEGFRRSFEANIGFLGYKMEVDDTLVGYFGCNTVDRMIDGKMQRFYNSHTWIVADQFRQHSIKLLLPFTKLSDGIVTNFTPTEAVRQLLLRFKFKEVRYNRWHFAVMWPIITSLKIVSLKSTAHVSDQEVKSIIDHHRVYTCEIFEVAMKDHIPFYLVLRRTSEKWKLAEWVNKITKWLTNRPLITGRFNYYIVHYCSDWTMFNLELKPLLGKLLYQFGIGGLIVPEDRLSPHSLNLPRKPSIGEFSMYKCEGDLPFRLDQLYSEIFYLNVYNR